MQHATPNNGGVFVIRRTEKMVCVVGAGQCSEEWNGELMSKQDLLTSRVTVDSPDVPTLRVTTPRLRPTSVCPMSHLPLTTPLVQSAETTGQGAHSQRPLRWRYFPRVH